ncbi:MAG: hypothetical protein ACJ8F3_00930 [Xanthobacteraceae bacterium]
MTLRDGLTLSAILTGLVLMFFVSRQARDERVEPGSPEHSAYIEGLVAECLEKQWTWKAEGVDPRPPAEREAACREYVEMNDRMDPSGRPLRRR